MGRGQVEIFCISKLSYVAASLRLAGNHKMLKASSKLVSPRGSTQNGLLEVITRLSGCGSGAGRNILYLYVSVRNC